MLSPRDNARSVYSEALSMGSASVLGGDMREITTARLHRARRAEQTVQAAVGTPRTGLLEPSDDVLEDMLRRLRGLVLALEARADQYTVRGGPYGDDAA